MTYIMAYDPDRTTSSRILAALPESGADIIELGMPFSDPMADGPAIQLAGQRALKTGAKMKGILEMVAEFRQKNTVTPIVLMGYYNPVLHYGVEAFAADAAQSGADALLIVDVPPEEDAQLFAACNTHSLNLIKLITPTTDDARLKTILPHASGFLYYVTIAGITGTTSASANSIQKAVRHFKKQTDLPIVAGFGIKTPEDVKNLRGCADALVVGSALVKQITDFPDQAEKKVLDLVKALSGK